VGAAEPRFGTHPIAWAAPAGEEAGFLFDASCCQVAANKITLARRLHVKLAEHWVADEAGRPIDHEIDPPESAVERMLPAGGTREQGSHKGYGLACMVDIMSNCLSGMGPGFLTGGGGSIFTATDITAFTDLETYTKWIDAFLRGLRQTPAAPDAARVLYPGLRGGELTKQRSELGIP
jgi:LDH2 family malate/lactate/ureidoglycolate dehydrogenase